MWKEYREIASLAESHEGNARSTISMWDADHPTEALIEAGMAQAEATLALSKRLEALTYVIRKAKLF